MNPTIRAAALGCALLLASLSGCGGCGKDTTPPEITVTGVEDGKHSPAPVTVGFSATDDNPGPVTATLDGADFASGGTVSQEGEHSLVVTARDTEGNTATREVGFVVDLTRPSVQLSGLPPEPLVNHAVTLGWTVTDAHLERVEAKLDGQDATSGTTVSAPGAHTLVVTAWDKAGNTASQTAPFTIALAAPVIRVTGVEDGERRNTPATVAWTVEGTPPVTVTARLDGGEFASGGEVSAPGEHTLVITARDGAGNETVATRTFVIDTTPPTVVVESPADGLATEAAEVVLVATVSDEGPLADVEVGDVSLTRGADGRYRVTLPLEEGGNAFTVVAFDVAGNSRSVAFQVVRDTRAPVLSVTAPEEGIAIHAPSIPVTGTVTDATAVSVTVSGNPATLGEGGAFSATQPLQPGDNTVVVVATDAVGHQTVVRRAVRRIGPPPTLTVTDPPEGYSFPEAFVTVRGEAAASEAGDMPRVTVDGNAAAVDARGRFAYTLEVPPGPHTVRVTAVDRYGQSTQRELQLVRLGGEAPDSGTDAGVPDSDAGSPGPDAGTPGTDGGSQEPAPMVVLEAPADGTVVGGMRFAVLGRVEGGVLPLQVTVNGSSASVSSRDFSASLALLEGPRTVSVSVRDAQGRTATAQRQVVVDRTAPFIEITRPSANPARVSESPYLLQGTVGDANLAGVTVRGEPVNVVAGSFSVPVSLTAGDNAIPVEAVDLAGNRRSVVQTLSIDGVPPSVTILEPLDGAQAEAAIIAVRARVTGGTGELDVRVGTGAATREASGVYTAQVPLSLGENVIPVTATDAQGLSGSARVTVRYRDVTREPLAVTGVDPVPGAVEVETDALVSVAFNKPVRPEGVGNHFTVWARGERLVGGYSVAPGAQTVTFVAGSALPAGERITVRVSGLQAQAGPGMSAAFATEFTVRQPLTVVRGTVMDERLQALSGVKVEVEGQELSTRTGPDGNWALVGVQGGASVVLRYEGAATSDGKTLPVVRRQLFVTPGKETVDKPLALIPVDGASARAVDGAVGGTLSFPTPQGPLKLEVEEGGLAFMDGSTRGFLTVTEIPPYLRPVPLDGRLSVDALWQLGPERVQLLRQPRLTLPNRTNLPAGRMVVLLAYDARKLTMGRVGIGRVAEDGAAIVSEGEVSASSLEFFGYMALTPEMQVKLEEALAQNGAGSPADGGTSLDGGLGLKLEKPQPDFWQRVADTVIGSAHAQQYRTDLPFFWWLMDLFPGGVAFVKGTVRAPRERQTELLLELPELVEGVEVDLPYRLQLDFSARHDATTGGSEVVTATVGAVGPNGSPIASVPGAWLRTGIDEASLASEVDLDFGTTTFILSGKTRYDTRAIRLKATLEPVTPDGGTQVTKGRLTVRREVDSSDGSEPFDAVVRFANMPVSITSYLDSGGVTNDKGQYSALVYVPAADTMGIACAEIPLGPRYNAHIDWFGNTRFTAVNGTFPICSTSFYMYPEAFSFANIYVDMRLLYGNVTFKNKDGRAVPGPCGETERDARTGELTSISDEDVATTEVHFFREDDLEQPIARYAVTKPRQGQDCSDPENPPRGSHGLYSRVRMGPSSGNRMLSIRNRCRQLEGRTGLSPEEQSFFKAECGASSSAFLRLSPGDRLVVFAVNHATGYAGMQTVTVPSINQNPRGPDGTCPEDEAAGGPLEVMEAGRPYTLSRCSQQELGIPGNIDLYPPEIDVRVKRRAQAEGLRQFAPKHLIRTGGAGTTRDEYVQVTTHWRVRRAPLSTDGGTDGGIPTVPEEDCDKGFLADGGTCKPSVITDDDADAGLPLQMFCSELAPGASARQWAVCLRDNTELSDVPKGAPPLKGQIVRVTGGALEQPAVTVFDVAPGLNTVNVQSSLRRVNQDGEQVTLNNLVRANYYLHVVGNRLLERDRNGDGFIDTAENQARPPHFEEGDGLPPGMPEHALYLKNVFKRYDENGVLVDQYDLAREHEFRVLELESRKVTARQENSERELKDEAEPTARARDLSYDFLAHLLAPDDPGRAGTLSGEYRVRLGSDQFGVDCPLKVDSTNHTISATCGGAYVGDILGASDILYIELYLSGNAENILYRFNFYGLAPRKDYVSASARYTSDAATEQDEGDGTPAKGRPVSESSAATFFIEPAEMSSGMLKLCLNTSCAPERNLLKEVALNLNADGSYAVQDTDRGTVRLRLHQSKNSTSTGARRFRLPLPPHLAGMPGSSTLAQPVFLILETERPVRDRQVMQLGKPEGTYNGAHARAVGQEVVAGVNVTDGHLAFEHVDFALPFLNNQFAFKRTYNNQNNVPSHLGIGWTHNFDGWLLEERVGRYIAVVGGQGFVFPNCPVEPKSSDLYGNTLGTEPCKVTDNSHGFELRVEAPMDGEPANDKLVLKTQNGWTFEFNQMAKGPRDEGRRRWMLTRFADSHGRESGDVGWTKLEYEPDSERLSRVTQASDVGTVSLDFTYEAVATEDEELPDAIRILARSKGFKWMRGATLSGGAGGTYSLRFEQDRTGNLTRVSRSPGSPYQSYEYTYWPVPPSLDEAGKWEALNELAVARLIHGDSELATGPAHWRASYRRSTESAPYKHIRNHEMVSSVAATGMQNGRVDINYTSATERRVTWPDGVQMTLTLNESGNANRTVSPAGTAETFWGSDSRGGQVFAQRQGSPSGRELTMAPSSRLVLQKVSLTKAPSGSRAVAGLENDPELISHILEERFGEPRSTTLKSGTGSVEMASPRDEKGDLLSVTVSNSVGTYSLFSNARYTADGLLEGSRDAQGRDVTLSNFNGLGQPQQQTFRLSGATSGGLSAVTRTLTYDGYGRVLRWEDSPTGAFESWTYDGLGRVLTHVRSGTPQESWTYTYDDRENAQTVTESLARAGNGTVAAHQRTLRYTDGRLEQETFSVGAPAVQATRTYVYENARLTSSTDETGNERSYDYDVAGRLERVTVGGLREVHYTLDAEGNPYYVTDDLGRRTTVAYDGLGRPVFWDWGHGDTEELKLDAQGNPVGQKLGEHSLVLAGLDPLGNAQSTDSEGSGGGVHEKRRYDAAGRLTRLEDDELGLVETYEYGDVLGRPTRSERTVMSGGSTLRMVETRSYNDAAHTVTVSRTIGTGDGTRTEEETHTVDTAGRTLSVQREVDGQQATDSFQYTERGQVWWHRSATGAITQRLYDAMGHLVKVVDPEENTLSYELDAAGRPLVERGPHPGYVTTYTYDALGRPLTKSVAAHGTTPAMSWSYAYLSGTQEVRETANLGDGSTITTTRRFNARNRVVREVVSGTSGSREADFEFDGPWQKSAQVSEGSGWVAGTSWPSRDDRGRALREVEHWTGGGESYRYETTTAWDKRSARITTSEEAGGRQDSRNSRVEVDSLGNVVSLTRGAHTDTWRYDAAGKLVREAPAGSPATAYTYENGLLKQASYGSEDTVFTYYADGLLKSRTHPDGRQLQLEYWPGGKVRQSRFGRQGDFQATGYTYDANGALLSVTQGAGGADAQTWQYTRGARGELLTVTQPGAGVFTYAYDGMLRLKRVTPPAGGNPEETFAYDFLGRSTLRTRGGSRWQTTWSAAVGTQVDSNMDTTVMVLDGRGRLARVDYEPGEASAPQTGLTGVRYAYTSADQPWLVKEAQTSGGVDNTFTYDARGLLERVSRNSDAVSFTYTSSGQRRTMTSAAGTVTYGYDGQDRLASVTSPAGVTEVEWEPGGERLTALRGGGLAERRCYDARGRLTAVLNASVDASCGSLGSASGLHSRFDYTYDGRGNRLRETYQDGQLASAQVTEYGYDAADRMTGVRYPDGVAQLFRLAGDGTRLEEKEAAGYTGTLAPGGFASAAARRHWRYGLDARGGLEGVYDQLRSGQRVATYETDAVGRLTLEQTSAGSKEYGWDAAGRLTRMVVQPAVAGGGGGNITATYTYGWDGLRRSRRVNSQAPTQYLWAGESLVEERLPGQPAQLYAQIAGMAVSVGNERIAHDGLGSAVGRVGATDTWHRYDAWGGYRTDQPHWKVPGTAEASLGYTGHAFDAEVGLTYAQQRWYAPHLGRFLSQDPVLGNLTTPSSLNPWSYGSSNPTAYVDRDGRTPTIVTALIGGALGGAFGCGLGALSGGWDGCKQGAAIGAASGFLAGLTAGVSLAYTGSALIAGTAGGAVGAFSGASMGSYASGKTVASSLRTGLYAAPIGALGGAAGYALGQVGGALAARMGASTVAREAVETIVEGVGDDIVSQGAGIATRIQAGDVDVRGSLAISSLFGGARFMGARRAARYALEAERGVPGKLHSTPGAIKTAGDMYEYEPKRQLFGQTTPDTCAVACARMRLHDLGRISPGLGEDAVRRMLWMSKTDGNPIADLPGKLRAVFGVKSKFEWLSLKELDEATRHEPAIVSVKITGTAHAIIVDRVQRGFVMVRDPTQNPAIFGPNWEKNPGAAYRVPIEDFRMVYERAGGLGKAVTFRRADE